MNDSETQVIPESVGRLWDCVKKALAENDYPSPRDIDRLAASLGMKLPASTIEGWFKTCSVVPAWDKFEVLIKALGAEQDEDWRALHGAALTTDRKRKKEERKHKRLVSLSTPAFSGPSAAVPIGQSPDPTPTVPADAVYTTGAEGGTAARNRFWTAPWKIVVAILFLVLAIALILAFQTIVSSGRASSELSGGGAPVRYCAYVTKEPAGVYPVPDIRTKQIKFKYLNDRVEILDRPHPSEWIAVRTPQDSPGFNWMQTNVLTNSAPCKTPLPGQG